MNVNNGELSRVYDELSKINRKLDKVISLEQKSDHHEEQMAELKAEFKLLADRMRDFEIKQAVGQSGTAHKGRIETWLIRTATSVVLLYIAAKMTGVAP